MVVRAIQRGAVLLFRSPMTETKILYSKTRSQCTLPGICCINKTIPCSNRGSSGANWAICYKYAASLPAVPCKLASPKSSVWSPPVSLN